MSKYSETETENLEFKRAFSDTICKEVVSFLNSNGGDIIIGVDNDGNIIGASNIDETLRKISDVITSQIEPNPQELVSSELKYTDGKTLIVVHIPKGTRPIYCQKKYGFSSTGCTIRIGTTCKEMTPEQIRSRYEMNFTDTDFMTMTRARYGNISFRTLKIYYESKGFHLDDKSFETNLELRNSKGEYNQLAELLSDKNTIPLIVVKFRGKDKSSISERSDYGSQCLLFAYEQLKNRLIAENICMTDTTVRPRKDRYLFDFDCVNEALINALVHNDWNQSQPLISLFEDRIEILSHGGLPAKETKELFFQGISNPRNDMLMRVFLNMELTEHTGHGIPTIVRKYGKSVFQLEEHFINVVIPFDEKVAELCQQNGKLNDKINGKLKNVLSQHRQKALSILLEHPDMTIADMAKELALSARSISRMLTELRAKGYIIRSGARKNGSWIVIQGVVNSKSKSN